MIVRKGKKKQQEISESPKKLKKKGELLAEKKKEDRKKSKSKLRSPKQKDNAYIMKKNTQMKVLRIVFWTMLCFVFFRGLYQIVKPQKEVELRNIIKQFRQEQQSIGDGPEEVMNFAEDFAKEYLTYFHSGEQDFKQRIQPYVTKRIYNMANIYSFKHAARATYVNAYRKEHIKNGTYDVYINAEVAYDKGEQGIEYENCTMKVPVQETQSGYCIIGIPLYVQDNRLDPNYNLDESTFGSEIDNSKITPAVNNFLEAYYEQDQAMINYLLTPDADKGNFIGMGKRYRFNRIESLKAYHDAATNTIRCIVKIRILDSINEEEVYQELNLTLVEKDDKLYIKEMDTKIIGLM